MSKTTCLWFACVSLIFTSIAVLAFACSGAATGSADGGDGFQDDTGIPGEDGGGGTPDAGDDGGTAADTGVVDDTGTAEDAGAPDAGEADAGDADGGVAGDGGQTVGMFFNIGLIQMMGQQIGLAAGAFYPETLIWPTDPNADLKGLAPGTCRSTTTTVPPECQADTDCAHTGQTCVLDTDQNGKPVPNTGHCVNPTGSPIDIGPVTLTGLVGGPNDLKYNSGQKGAYTVDGAGDGSVDPATVATDATYTFSGAGDPSQGLGTFSGTLYVPPAISVLEPVPTQGQFGDEITIDTAADFVLKWEGSTSGYVRVSITGDNSGLECLTRDDGEFTIPASMLKAVKPAAFAIANTVTIERRVTGSASGQGLVDPQVSSIVSIMVFWKKP